MRIEGRGTRMVERRDVYKMLVGKRVGKRTLGRPRLRWEGNIKIGLHLVGYGGMNCLELAQDSDRWRVLLKAVMKLRVP